MNRFLMLLALMCSSLGLKANGSAVVPVDQEQVSWLSAVSNALFCCFGLCNQIQKTNSNLNALKSRFPDLETEPNRKVFYNGNSGLMGAALTYVAQHEELSKDVQLVKYLVSLKGIDLNVKDSVGCTALLRFAAMPDREDSIAELAYAKAEKCSYELEAQDINTHIQLLSQQQRPEQVKRLRTYLEQLKTKQGWQAKESFVS